MPDVGVTVRVCGGCHEGLSSCGAQLYQLAPIGVFPVAALRPERYVPPVRMRAALATTGKRRRQEASGDLYGFGRVEIGVYAVARRFAAQDSDVLAVGPVARYLLLSNPQRFPAWTAGVFLAGGDRDHGHAAADEGSCSAALLRVHAAAPSGSTSPRATSIAAAISASGTKPS